MAHHLIWRDLTQQHLDTIRHPHPKKGLSGRDLLAKFLGIQDPKSLTHGINLDLYVHTLQFGESLKLTDDKLSGVFSIIKATHMQSVGQKLTVENSFRLFKDLLLMHSVQRPPYSIGLLSFAEMKSVMDWMLDTYYRHYKLYQYAFTDRVTMSVSTEHPCDELEPLPALQPLEAAMTEEEYSSKMTDEERAREEAAAAERAAAEANADAERMARLRDEYVASIPEAVRDRVQEVLVKEVELLQTRMQTQFSAQEGALLERIKALEVRAAGGRPITPKSPSPAPSPTPKKA